MTFLERKKMKVIKINLQNSRYFGVILAAFFAVLIFGFPAKAQEAATETNTNQAAATPTPTPVPTPIAPSNIVSQAEAAEKKLQEIQTSLSESPGVQVINEELPKLKSGTRFAQRRKRRRFFRRVRRLKLCGRPNRIGRR